MIVLIVRLKLRCFQDSRNSPKEEEAFDRHHTNCVESSRMEAIQLKV